MKILNPRFIIFVGFLFLISSNVTYAAKNEGRWQAPEVSEKTENDKGSVFKQSEKLDEEDFEEGEEEEVVRPAPPPVKQPPKIAEADKSKDKSKQALVVSYVKPKDEAYTDLARDLEGSKGIEEIVEHVNKTYNFPHIDVVFDMCGEANAYYDSSNRQITLCYEMVGYLASEFQKDEELSDDDVGQQVISSLIFTFFHELGHAAVDVWDLPVTGKEEDAVDYFATLILLSGSDDEVDLAESALPSFDLQTAESLEDLTFWDVHSVDEQRWYSMACLMVGSDEEKYGYLVGEDGLPPERAETCPFEYEKASKSWETLLKPHLKKA